MNETCISGEMSERASVCFLIVHILIVKRMYLCNDCTFMNFMNVERLSDVMDSNDDRATIACNEDYMNI